MTVIYPNQPTFARGELSPRLHSRADIEHWRMGLAECVNWMILKQGGLRRRPGTQWINSSKGNGKVKLQSFVFSAEQAYIIEMGANYFRFYANGGLVFKNSEAVSFQDNTNYGTNYVDWPGHGLSDRDPVFFNADGGTLPGNVVDGTTYYVKVVFTVQGAATMTIASPCVVTKAAHGLNDDDPVYFTTTGALPTGLKASTSGKKQIYYVRNATANTFELADRPGASSSITTTGTQSGVHTLNGPSNRYFQISATRGGAAITMLGAAAVAYSGTATAPTELETDWTADEVWELQFAQSADVLYITHKDYQPKQLNRLSGSVFELVDYENKFGPYQDMNSSDTKVTCSGGTGNEVIRGTVTLTFDGRDGIQDINNGKGFTADDVGRWVAVQLKRDDKMRWHHAKITTITSTRVVTGTVYGWHDNDGVLQETFPRGRDPTTQWKLGAWGEVPGFPAAVSFFSQRLCFARTDAQPQTVWMTEQGLLQSFATNALNLSTDALTITLLSGEVNEIRWIKEGRDLIVGTSGNVRTIGKADSGKNFDIDNAVQEKQSSFGVREFVDPVQIGPVTIFPESFGTALREFLFSFQQNSYISPEVSILSEHMLKSGIEQMAYAQSPDSIVWCAMGNGELVGMTYERDQQIVAMARHRLGGRFAGQASTDEYGIVESVACIPGTDRNEVWLSVKRTINNQTVRYIERMSIPFEGTVEDKDDCVCLDASYTYGGNVDQEVLPLTSGRYTYEAESSPSGFTMLRPETLGGDPVATNTLSNITWLKNTLVSVLADGAVMPDQTITSAGVLTLPTNAAGVAKTASKIVFGLKYLSRAKTLPIAQGTGDGSGLGRKKNAVKALVDVFETGFLEFGAVNARTLDTAVGKRTPTDPMGTSPPLYTGWKEVHFDRNWDTNGQIIMQTDKPLPATIRSVTPVIDTEP